MTLTDKIAALREGLDEMDRINSEKSARQKKNDELEADILKDMADQGMVNDGDKMTACGLTVTRQDKQRAAYDPDKWADVVRWAVATGNDHIIQRRLTDKKVVDLVENGIALPEGLRIDIVTELSTRRQS